MKLVFEDKKRMNEESGQMSDKSWDLYYKLAEICKDAKLYEDMTREEIIDALLFCQNHIR